ncbi:MAG: ASKHA domain-containing protein, partial [Bacillota bacterium]|nr:ASKHA domain-containing protein [Bacillota bacterium]
MSTLIVHNQQDELNITFEGKTKLSELLTKLNVMPQQPCGGNGKCGKCVAFVYKDGQSLEETKILTCQAYVEDDTEIYIPKGTIVSKIQTDGIMPEYKLNPRSNGIGCAVDIGTTTVVLRLINLDTGEFLPAVSVENPQRAIASDVINRIQASLKGKNQLQKQLIHNTLSNLLERACEDAGIAKDDVKYTIVTGNTTMLYLYTGRSPKSLTEVPYTADCTFGFMEDDVYFPPCFGAYVGADIYTAILASDLVKDKKTALLIDLGTNGEIALYKDGKLTCCATACGPAFEGAGIDCGGPATDGAIDHIWVEDDEIKYSVIGKTKPTHLCGSAVIDAVAALLKTNHISEMGKLDSEYFEFAPGIKFTNKDVRQIQLAKSAICAGIKTLMEVNGVTADDIGTFY